MRRCRIFPGIILACLFWAANAHGGPPLLTDDPDTPGPNHWEINAATMSEEINHAWLLATPLLDINYGVGDHIQLKYQVQFNELVPAQGGALAGMVNSLAGVKWRFLDQTNSSWLEISTYPQLEFVYPSSSGRRGLADSGDNVLLPIELEHQFKSLTKYGELGYLHNEYKASGGWYGLAAQYDFSEKFSLMGEFYGGFDRAFEHNWLSLNIGFRRALVEHVAPHRFRWPGPFWSARARPGFPELPGAATDVLKPEEVNPTSPRIAYSVLRYLREIRRVASQESGVKNQQSLCVSLLLPILATEALRLSRHLILGQGSNGAAPILLAWPQIKCLCAQLGDLPLQLFHTFFKRLRHVGKITQSSEDFHKEIRANHFVPANFHSSANRRFKQFLPALAAALMLGAGFARAHGAWTYEPRQGRNAATAVCSASAVVALAFLLIFRTCRIKS